MLSTALYQAFSLLFQLALYNNIYCQCGISSIGIDPLMILPIDLNKSVSQQTFVLIKTSWRRLSSSSSEDVFMTSSISLDEDQIIDLVRRLQHVFKTSSKNVFKTSSRLIQDVFKTSSRHLQDLFKTFWRRLTKTSSRSLVKISSRCFQEVSPS